MRVGFVHLKKAKQRRELENDPFAVVFWSACPDRLANMFLHKIAGLAKFTPEKMGKSTLVQGDYLFAGLNSFEPGQEHAPHAHQGQDKMYLVLEGSGVVRIDDHAEVLSAGDAAFAPAGILHSIRNPGPERLVVMAVLSPPPSAG
jgi:quercetin dioxygenase-like cupin family protein